MWTRARSRQTVSALRHAALALALIAVVAAAGYALAADPGGKDDPLATVSFVTAQAGFTRLELARGQIVLVGSGAELVVVGTGSSGEAAFSGLTAGALVDLTAGAAVAAETLTPNHHYVNAGAAQLKLKPGQPTTVLLRGNWR